MAEPGQDWKIAALMFLYLCASFFLELIRLKEDKYYMKIAYKEAEKAYKENEIPIGAVIVCDGKVLSRAHNKRDSSNIVTRHAEIIAIEKANKKKKNWRLNDCILYTTLEPCNMCKEVIKSSKISKIVYAAVSTNNNNDLKEDEFIQIKDKGIIEKSTIIIQNAFKQIREKDK